MTGVVVFLLTLLVIAGILVLARSLEAADWRRELVHFQLRFPRGLSVEQVAAWLAALPPRPAGPLGRPPIRLEVVAREAGIEHRLSVRAWDVEALTAQLQTALPGIRLERLSEEGANDLPVISRAVQLRETSRRLPLASERAEGAAAALLAALQPLGPGEVIRLQWLVCGASVPGLPGRRSASTSRGGRPLLMSSADGDRRLSGDELRGVRRKHAAPLLLACGRIGVEAPAMARKTQLLGRVQAALSVMDAPGVRIAGSVWPSPWVVARLHGVRLPVLGWPLELNAREAVGVLGVPVGELDLPGLELGTARQLPAGPKTIAEGVVLGVSDHPGTLHRALRLSTDDRLRHLHLVGPTGTGKSTLMAGLALQDLAAGRGLVVVDPKRDLVEVVMARLPADRLGDVVVLDPTDTDRPVGLNVLAGMDDSEAERELASEQLLGVFQNLWKDSWGPRSDDILRAGLMTLSSATAADGSAFTLVELPELLTVKGFRSFVLAQESIPPHVRGFWQWFETTSPWERSQALAPVLNKVRAFTMRTPVRLLLGQSRGFDLRRLTDGRGVVLVPLSAGELGRPAAELLGSLIVAAVWQTIRARTAVPADERTPVFVYLDEFQDVLRLPLDLTDLLAQARGLGAGLTLAHQHLGQLPTDVRAAVLATARSQAVFQVAEPDARVLARGFEPSLGYQDLMGLDGFHFALRPVVHGRVVRAVTGRSLPLEPGGDPGLVRRASRERYGVPRDEVEDSLRKRTVGAAARPPIGRRKKAAT